MTTLTRPTRPTRPREGSTIRIAPERTATPQAPTRTRAPASRRLGEAFAGTAGLATVVGLLVAPLAVLSVGGVVLACLTVAVGAPALSATVAAVFQRRISPRRAQGAAQVLLGTTAVGVGVAMTVAVAGMGWMTAHLDQPGAIAGMLPHVVGGCGYALLIATSALGAALELRRD